MPELPEMQALAERLDALLRGSMIVGASPLQFSASKTFDPPLGALIGQPVGMVTRRGKFLVFELSQHRLLAHLSQGGRVVVEQPPRRTRPKGGVLRLSFDVPAAVLIKEFGTQRKAAWWVLSAGEEGPLASLGPEPASSQFEDVILAGDDRRRLHTFLRDQRSVAGIGRGYVDEILHEARLSPFDALAGLDSEERRNLVAASRRILERGLELERRRTGGLPDKLSGRFVIHGRAGDPCPRCDSQLRRVSFADYEITYCPRCQTEGRVLDDRRLSRLLR